MGEINQHGIPDIPKNRFARYFWNKAKRLADDDPTAGSNFMFTLWDELVEVGETLDACASAENLDDFENAASLANSIMEKYAK
jgi:hypothetical protein